MTSITVYPRAAFTPMANGELVADASDLRLRPGRWPNTITLDDGTLAFRRDTERDAEGEVRAVRYASTSGTTRITVFND